METAGFELQVVVFATRLKGEVTWAPFEGDLMVMADADTTQPASIINAKDKVFMRRPRAKDHSERGWASKIPKLHAWRCLASNRALLWAHSSKFFAIRFTLEVLIGLYAGLPSESVICVTGNGSDITSVINVTMAELAILHSEASTPQREYRNSWQGFL